MKPVQLALFGVSFLLVFGGSGWAGPATRPCIELKQSQPFHFEGTLTSKIFPGPPNYQDVRKGDKPEPTYILQLSKPVCVSGDEFIEPNKQIDRIQVFPDYADRENQALRKELRRLVGKVVAVDGREPFGAHTGHHHAPFLLPINKITLASKSAPESPR